MITDVRMLMGQLAAVDRVAAVWCACQCARSVLHLVPEDEDGAHNALRVADAWVRRKATKRACLHALLSSSEKAAGVVERDDFAPPAAGAAGSAVFASKSDSPHWAACAAYWATKAAASGSSVSVTMPSVVIYDADFAADNALMVSRVVVERWPLTRPTPAQLATSSESARVAWDAVAEATGDHRIPELLESRARADRLGLEWNHPVQRAIAERAADEGRIRRLLRSGG